MKSYKLLILVMCLAFTSLLFSQAFQVPINVTDGQNSKVLRIGVDPNGTPGYDPGLDTLAPPPPPPGAFDTRLSNANEDFFTDIRDNSATEKQFHMKYAAATGMGPIVLTWDPASLPSLGSFTIVDDITGTLYGPLDMSTVGTLTITDPLILSGLRILLIPVVGIEDPDPSGIPARFEVAQNYPNPFNPSTDIRYALPRATTVEVAVYNALGQKIRTLVSSNQKAGYHTVRWDATNDQGQLVSSGIYFYGVTTPEKSIVQKMVYMR